MEQSLKVGRTTIGSLVLGELFDNPEATAETVGIVEEYGNGVSAIEFEGDIRVVRPLPKGFSVTRYQRLSEVIAGAYNSEYISLRPGVPQPFSAFFEEKGEQRRKNFISLPYVEGEIIQQPDDFLGMDKEFQRGVLRGLAEGEYQLTTSAWNNADIAALFKPKWKYVGNITPITFRCFQLALNGSIVYVPSLLYEIKRFGIDQIEKSFPKRMFYQQGNCELYISRPGALLQDNRLVLLEVAHAGRIPYPGQDLAKLVGRTILPSVPGHNYGDREECVALAQVAITVLLETWANELDPADVEKAFAILVFLQLIESYADNRWHLDRMKEKIIPGKQEWLQTRLGTALMFYRCIFPGLGH
ncbi:hypothetical protein ACFL24_01525 [Patescibacteria group bacterium]